MGACKRGEYYHRVSWIMHTQHMPQRIARMDIPGSGTHLPPAFWSGDRLVLFLSTHTRGSNFPLPKGGEMKSSQTVPSIPDGELFYRILILCQTPFCLAALVQSGYESLPIRLPFLPGFLTYFLFL